MTTNWTTRPSRLMRTGLRLFLKDLICKQKVMRGEMGLPTRKPPRKLE